MEWNYEDLQFWIENGCDSEISKQIVTLDISCNNLTEIPKEIGKLTNLQIFFCFSNQIMEIPKVI